MPISEKQTSTTATTAPTQVVHQANQSTAAATNPAQISEGETAPASTVLSKLPEGKELEEYLKSDSHAAREKA